MDANQPLAGAIVLVTEEDPDLAALVARLLREVGAAPTTAADGAEALRLVCDRKFDALVTGLRIPRVNVIELIRLLRLTSPGTRIVAIMGSNDPEVFLEAMNLKVDASIRTPFTGERLVETLRSVLGAGAAFSSEKSGNR